MPYRLEYAPGVLKGMQRIPRDVQRRILSRLEELQSNPWPPGSVKLTGIDAYRVRIGDYRTIYSINDDRLACWSSTSVIAGTSIGVCSPPLM